MHGLLRLKTHKEKRTECPKNTFTETGQHAKNVDKKYNNGHFVARPDKMSYFRRKDTKRKEHKYISVPT